MNIMRKWWGVGSRSFGDSVDGSSETSQAVQQHLTLGLMHLKKLFSEFSYPSHPIGEIEKEDRLYKMLPLFCKVFGNSQPTDIEEKFADVLIFTQHVSKLMVTEIRRRASNQSTEAASCAIIHFLEIDNCEENSNGWLLLSSLNILAAGPSKPIEVMTAASLPSTLVKCLYLFFDLPENDSIFEKCSKNTESNNKEELSDYERRALLQKVFVQLLVRLCSHIAPSEELSRKDDLSLLFSAITTWCPKHNAVWRKSAAEVLMILSRHGLSQPVVSYIHNKGCVSLCVENMERGGDLSPLEIVEMFVTVFCFLKDSSDVAQTLLDDFRQAQGYAFLAQFILRLEKEESSESSEALRNLVLLVSSLSYCGYYEMKASSSAVNPLFNLPGFSLPLPAGRGLSVRNLQAFNVLQSVFLRGSTSALCSMVLDAINAIYQSDPANYFILETQGTFSAFAEIIHLRSSDIQEKFFQLLEMVVFQLNFVPCKELISLSLLLKVQISIECCLSCMNSLLTILKHNVVFKDVYREVGLLEIFVTCLAKYNMQLGNQQGESIERGITASESRLGLSVLETITVLLSGNSQNASIFRDSGGSKAIRGLVQKRECRQQSLGLLQQLILSSGCDEDMGALLSLLQTIAPTDLHLKIDIIKTLLICLKESHRTRTVFRKVGGFIYLMSVLVSLEGCFSDSPPIHWVDMDPKLIMGVIIAVANTITTAMRYEPANAKYFQQEFCPENLVNSLKLLGCFSPHDIVSNQSDSPWKQLLAPVNDGEPSAADDINKFHSVFLTPASEDSPPYDVPLPFVRVIQLLQLLYNMALDSFDKSSPPSFYLPHLIKSTSKDRLSESSSSGGLSKPPPSGLPLNMPSCDPVIVHPTIVITMLHLLPSINHSEHNRSAAVLQLYAAHILKSLVRSERNQQVMCENDFGNEILEIASAALLEELHPLHPILQYIFERLAAQAILPLALRTFLRLGSPLNCRDLDRIDINHEESVLGRSVPLARIKALVSMTTARDIRLGPQVYPSFVEFDMCAEGFGCLFLPSIAPQNVGGNSVVPSALTNTQANVIGGIGSGDRVFPPQTGLTFSTWFCIERFSDPRTDPHSIRLLTIVRQVPGKNPLTCFCVTISARDKALIVSTHETQMPQSGQGVKELDPAVVGEFGCRLWCPDLLSEGQWHHLVLTLNRAVLKNSSLCIYIDGQLAGNPQKLHYILQNPGGGAANLNVASSVFAYIGTPPAYRRSSRLVWRQGPCHLVEDVLSPQMIVLLYQLGPHYTGCLQAPRMPGTESMSSIVSEDKMIFGLNATAISYLTLNKIRKVYSRVDNKAIAKQLGMSSHENATPIRLLHNSCGHLGGGSRTLGGVIVGYLGVRVFCPRPVSQMIQTIGGISVLLGLVAISKDVESLYASVKALSCVVKTSKMAQVEMDLAGGYQTLAQLLSLKKSLINSHILHLCMGLVLAGDWKQASISIPNSGAFLDLLCELEIWMDAPNDLGKTVLEHFLELAKESSERHSNIKIMRNLDLVSKLLVLLTTEHLGQKREMELDASNGNFSSDTSVLSSSTNCLVFNLLTTLLACAPRQQDLLTFGQFIISTLPAAGNNEKNLNLNDSSLTDSNTTSTTKNQQDQYLIKAILLRNKCLEILHTLLYNSNKNTIHLGFCEEVVKVLGLDWVVVLTQGALHHTTVLLAMKMLVALLSNNAILTKFRDASMNGGWLSNVSSILQHDDNSVGAASHKNPSSEIREDVCHMPGFQVLTWHISSHTHVPQLYYLLLALLLGHPVKNVQNNTKFDVDSIWTFLFGVPAREDTTTISGRVSLRPEAAISILAMIRAMLNQEDKGKELPDWLKTYPVTLIQFLKILYLQNEDFKPVFLSPEVLHAFGSTLFPYTQQSEPVSLTSPLEEKIVSMDDMVIVSNEKSLTNHPAKKQVMDLLKQLILDSLSLSPAKQGPQIIDYLLEANPSSSSPGQICEFQTQLLGLLMEHLLDAEILIGEGAAIPILTQGSMNNIAPNVFYVASRIVDKLWSGIFSKDPHEVFDFILKLISQSKKRASGLNLECIFHSLNRTVLYLLSRPATGIPAQMAILETLHKLTTHRSIVFGSGNHELEFIGCLTFCLLQLTADLEIITNSTNRTVWHVNPIPGVQMPMSSVCDGMYEAGQVSPVSMDKVEATATQGHNLMSTAATRVWEELYITKKPAVEEVFKVTLPCSSDKAPDLGMVRDRVYDNALKLWLLFLEAEKKQSYKMPWDAPTQIQSVTNKLQKVTGGLTRLASRTKSRREDSIIVRKVNLSMSEVQLATLGHISIVKDVVNIYFKSVIQKQSELHSYAKSRWQNQERQLTRQRGLWGPEESSILDKWMQEPCEGPCRMRKKMVCNPSFYHQYPYKPHMDTSENRHNKYKLASSFDSKEFAFKKRPEGLSYEDSENLFLEELPRFEASEYVGKEVSEMDVKVLKGTRLKASCHDVIPEDEELETLDINELVTPEPQSEDSINPDKHTLQRLLEKGERASHMFRCARIQGLDTIEGLLIFGREHFYIVDHFTLLRNREIRFIGSLPMGSHEPIVPGSTTFTPKQMQVTPSKFHYDDIREVHQRRYLLQPIAIEIFASDGRNYLLALPKKHRNKVYQRLMVVCTGLADNAQNSVEGQRRSASVEQAGGLFSSIIGETSVTHRWVRGEISNFQYLMHLNTLAGRSYNDLMQYPVFPWILKDYESEDLDLQDPDTFRDLSKPMGAQTSSRLDQFRKRFREWDDPTGDTPPYHYGTHYSSAMIVASYLVRMEPFTQHFLRLQGGHFDLADRMFHSLKEAWNSAAQNNMADVKELIPEFFYLPEFMNNSNRFDFGSKQNGTPLDDVILPPWAKGDTREFIRVHRLALECDFVSSHLHEWIDLIFGFKQCGQPAVDAVNVFHHLFYEGNVDIYSIDDPLEKNATIGFINNFGQIPKQLFKKPHPCKRLGNQRTSIIDAGPLSQNPVVTPREKVFYYNFGNLRPSGQPIKEVKGAVGQIIGQDKLVLAVEQNKVLIPPTYQRYLAWGFADHSLRIGSYESDRALLVYEKTHPGEVLAAVCPNNKTIVTAGTSTVVTIYEIVRRQLKVRASLHGHKDTVTCLASCMSFGLLVSGSRDRTAIIWDVARTAFVRHLAPHEAPLAAIAINESTGDIATCAGTYLYLWSINGTPIANVNAAMGIKIPLQQILCVTFSTMYEWDNANVILTGSSDGVTRMWRLEYVQVSDDECSSENGDTINKCVEEDDEVVEELTLNTNFLAAPVISSLCNRKNSLDSRLTGDFKAAFLTKSISESSLSDESENDSSEKDLIDTFDVIDSASLTKEKCITESSTSSIPENKTKLVVNLSKSAIASGRKRSTPSPMRSKSSTEENEGASPNKDCGKHRLLHRQLALASTGSGSSLEASGHSIDSQQHPCTLSTVADVSMTRTLSSTTSPRIQTPSSKLHTSKSETSISKHLIEFDDTFVLVSKDDSQDSHDQSGKSTPNRTVTSATSKQKDLKTATSKDADVNKLQPGMKWVPQLVFRSKLTMHTAYDRQDNAEPASITAMAVSRDHRSVLIGDARGRIFSFNVPEGSHRGGLADHWQKDECADQCTSCGQKFTIYERKHHCRNCGHIYCSRCSRYESEIIRLRIMKPVRVCQKCFTLLQGN